MRKCLVGLAGMLLLAMGAVAQTTQVSSFSAIEEVITVVQFSADGKYMVVGTEKGAVIRTTMTHLKDVTHLYHHAEKPVLALALSNDGKHIVSMAEEGKIFIWEAATNATSELSVEVPKNQSTILTISPDNHFFAVKTLAGVTLYDLKTRAELGRYAQTFISSIDIRPDSKQLVLGTSISPEITVWNWADGAKGASKFVESAGALNATLKGVESLDYSPDGRYVAVSYKGDKSVRLVDWVTQKPLGVLLGKELVTQLSFTLDGQYLVCAREDGKVKVYNLPDLSLKLSLHEYPEAVKNFGLSNDGKYFVAADGKAPLLLELGWLELKPWRPADVEAPAIALISPRATRETLADGATRAQSNQRRVRVGFRVNDVSGVRSVEVNGKEVFPVEPGANKYELEEMMALEENKYVPLSIRAVDSIGNTTTQNFGVEFKPTQIVSSDNYYALFVAVQDYGDPGVPSLDNPVGDAQKLAGVLVDRYTFKSENVTVLANPTRAQLVERFEDLQSKLTSNDNLLVFYAGHGVWDEQMQQGFWLPADGEANSRANWFPNNTLRDYIANIKSKHTLLIADACFSGGIFKTRAFGEDASPAIEEMYRLNSRKAMTSGALKTVPDKSVFLATLIRSLELNTEDYVTASEFFNSFRKEVINNSPNHQVPLYGEIGNTGDQGGEFVFVRRKE